MGVVTIGNATYYSTVAEWRAAGSPGGTETHSIIIGTPPAPGEPATGAFTPTGTVMPWQKWNPTVQPGYTPPPTTTTTPKVSTGAPATATTSPLAAEVQTFNGRVDVYQTSVAAFEAQRVAFESKWSHLIQGETFTGTDAQFREYQDEFRALDKERISLSMAEQELKAREKELSKKQAEELAKYVPIGKNEYILKTDWDKLEPKYQAILKEQGFDALNSQISADNKAAIKQALVDTFDRYKRPDGSYDLVQAVKNGLSERTLTVAFGEDKAKAAVQAAGKAPPGGWGPKAPTVPRAVGIVTAETFLPASRQWLEPGYRATGMDWALSVAQVGLLALPGVGALARAGMIGTTAARATTLAIETGATGLMTASTAANWHDMSNVERGVSVALGLLMLRSIAGNSLRMVKDPAMVEIKARMGQSGAKVVDGISSRVYEAVRRGDVNAIRAEGSNMTRLGEAMKRAGVEGADSLLTQGSVLTRNAEKLAGYRYFRPSADLKASFQQLGKAAKLAGKSEGGFIELVERQGGKWTPREGPKVGDRMAKTGEYVVSRTEAERIARQTGLSMDEVESILRRTGSDKKAIEQAIKDAQARKELFERIGKEMEKGKAKEPTKPKETPPAKPAPPKEKPLDAGERWQKQHDIDEARKAAKEAQRAKEKAADEAIRQRREEIREWEEKAKKDGARQEEVGRQNKKIREDLKRIREGKTETQTKTQMQRARELNRQLKQGEALENRLAEQTQLAVQQQEELEQKLKLALATKTQLQTKTKLAEQTATKTKIGTKLAVATAIADKPLTQTKPATKAQTGDDQGIVTITDTTTVRPPSKTRPPEIKPPRFDEAKPPATKPPDKTVKPPPKSVKPPEIKPPKPPKPPPPIKPPPDRERPPKRLRPGNNEKKPKKQWTKEDVENATVLKAGFGWYLKTLDGRVRFFTKLPPGAKPVTPGKGSGYRSAQTVEGEPIDTTLKVGLFTAHLDRPGREPGKVGAVHYSRRSSSRRNEVVPHMVRPHRARRGGGITRRSDR